MVILDLQKQVSKNKVWWSFLTLRTFKKRSSKIVNFDLPGRLKRCNILAGRESKNELLGTEKNCDWLVNFDILNNRRALGSYHLEVVVWVRKGVFFDT